MGGTEPVSLASFASRFGHSVKNHGIRVKRGVKLIVWLQKSESPLVNYVARFFSIIGTEEFYLALTSSMYWCGKDRVPTAEPGNRGDVFLAKRRNC